MLTEKEARKFANHWVEAWNSRDLDEIMSHYDSNVVLVSPVAAKILNDSSGTVKGKEALRIYFQRGLDAYPNLRFELVECDAGLIKRCSLLRQSERHKDWRIYGN
jgi:ketosteroid isomerase-like protein